MLESGLVAVGLAVFVPYFVFPVIIRKVVVLPGRARNLVIQYFLAMILAWSAALIGHCVMGTNFEWKHQMLLVAVIGMANGIACYFQWKAIAINQALTSVSTWLDDIVALSLGMAVLSEFKLLNFWTVVGILLALGSSILFVTQKESLKGIKSREVIRVYKYIFIYSIIWGVAMFSMRYFPYKNQMSVWDFLPAWYSGSLIGSLFVYSLANSSDKGDSSTLRDAIKRITMLTGVIVSGLVVGYWARSLVPLIHTQPIFQVSEMIFPTLIALFIFGEQKNFTRLGWLLMLCGLIGGLIIATHLS